MTKDPNSYIQASAETLAETLLSKNSDYAPTGEFSNFEKAAEIANTGAITVMIAQAAIKLTRVQSLFNSSSVSNESLKDSLLDLAGYAVIAHAYLEYLREPDDRLRMVTTPHLHQWAYVGNKDVCEITGCSARRDLKGNVYDA